MYPTINAWWPKTPLPGNFGDIMTPPIVEQLFGYKCVRIDKPFKTPTLFGAGSIVSLAEENTVVWGSGLMDAAGRPCPDATYLAVRGPRTYEILAGKGIECPPIFGDPVLLTPLLYDGKEIKKKYQYGVFAHYVDQKKVSGWYSGVPGVKMINPINGNPMAVVREVLECEKIISSSLHGVIIAHAYDIPAVWVKHSNGLSGDSIKFHDYYDSVGLPAECIEFQGRIDPKDFSKFNYRAGIDIDLDELISALFLYLQTI